jgi:molybdenum cofactor synthesis domain
MSEMRRDSPYPMVSVDEAHRLIAANLSLLPTEEMSALEAFGWVLAQDVYAPEDMPDLPKSAMDGYALIASDGIAPRRVLAELTAGNRQDIRLEPGTAARIMTGAPLPAGADAVVIVEQTHERDGILTIDQAPVVGQYIQSVGQDIARGTLVLAKGTPLGAAEIGLLATVGQTRIQVYRRPRVAVLATGDEVVEPDAPSAPGIIRDSNRYALMAAVREAGGIPISLGIARDDQTTQRQAILSGLEQADLVLTSGGVSMGTRDLIKPILAELGTVHFGRIAYKPGKPTTFATVNGKIVFGLPGFPVSSLVSFEVFVRPTLRRLQGDRNPERPRVRVRLHEQIKPAPDRPEYQRVQIAWRDGQLVATSTGIQNSSRLLSLRGANGLLIVPPGESPYPAGSELEALLTGPLFTA